MHTHIHTNAGMCFEVLGVILGVGIYTFYFVGFVETTEEEECGGATREPNENQRRAYLYHAITVGVILIACILTTFLGVREQEGAYKKSKPDPCLIPTRIPNPLWMFPSLRYLPFSLLPIFPPILLFQMK